MATVCYSKLVITIIPLTCYVVYFWFFSPSHYCWRASA